MTEQQKAFLKEFSTTPHCQKLQEVFDSVILEVKDDVMEKKLNVDEAKRVIATLEKIRGYMKNEARQRSESNFV